MRYVAAYLLASLSGKEPSSADLEKILSSVGIEADGTKVKKILGELTGKNLEELIASGLDKLASMPVGGGAAPAAAPAAAAGSAAGSPKKEEKKEEKKDDTEDEDEDMGFGLFD